MILTPEQTEALNRYLSESLGVVDAFFYDYPIDANGKPISPKDMPKTWHAMPIVKYTIKWLKDNKVKGV